ncbi:MAG: AAA family ATPase [Thermodesulfobacteriota bacterium]
MNHLSFFGIKEEPFRLTPDRDFYFPSRSHSAVAEVVRYGLDMGEGFLIIYGEVGTGKTMLLRKLSNYLHSHYDTAYIISPQLSPRDLLFAILQDLDEVNGDTSSLSAPALFQKIYDYLLNRNPLGKRLLVIIDEAQNLPEDSIEQLRLLSNFETDKQKLMQILLVGQPELKEKIYKSSLRQLRQRITISETLYPLSRSEMAAYINFRLNRVGRADLAPQPSVHKIIHRYTNGTPRLINKLMSRALLMSYASGNQHIDKKSIKDAAESLEMRPLLNFWGRLRPVSV